MRMLRILMLAGLAGALFAQEPAATPKTTPVQQTPAKKASPKLRAKHARKADTAKPGVAKGDQGKADQAKASEAKAGKAAAKPSAPPTATKQPPVPVEAKPSDEIGPNMRACRPGDNSPAGTESEGWRKVIVQTPMGENCHWEK